MNPDRLLTHFERLAESPDAIPRLRRFVLDLAVRGRLVPQDPNDEPASELLKRITAEKARLAKGRRPGTFAPLLVDSDDEAPFDLPGGWMWVRLGNLVTKLTDGTHHSPPNGPTGEFKYVTAKNIKNNGVSLAHVTYVSRQVHEEIFSRCDPAKGDVLYIKDGATTGVVTINDLDEPFSMLSSVALIKLPTCLFNRLIVEFLRSPFFYDQMRGFMKGAAITRVTLKRMAPTLVPLPPLPEQHRIVAKVDELMALWDRLESARNEREDRRDRLVSASLHRLSQPSDEDGDDAFRADARFYFNHLPRLTTRPDHIKQLRQTILSLAVRGRLVPQDPHEEPASELLKCERRTIEADENVPFSIPRSWLWVRVGTIADTRLGKMLDKSKNSGTPRRYIRNINVRWFDFDLTDVLMMRFEDSELEEFTLREGDVIVCEGGEPGRAAVWDSREDKIYFQKALHRMRFPLAVDPYYFVNVLRESADSKRLATYFTGTGIKHLTGKGLSAFLVPLPPLAEQKRIVSKVNELMALCDRLEASLAEAETDSRRLLEAVLHEALTPESDYTLEAVA